MPRGPRLDSPGLLHHVRLRGVERRDIFMDDVDRESFCGRLESVCCGGKAEVLAWCLMSNHVHLALRCGSLSLASVMRRLLTGYAMSFNKRHGRVGHLFQNRYKSTVVESERYLVALVRYIHLNPVAAGFVRSVSQLEDYPWCGYGALMGNEAWGFQSTDEVLARFGTTVEVARVELRQFMGDLSSAQAESEIFEGGGLTRSVGGRKALGRLREDVRQGKSERVMHDARVLGSSDVVAELLQAEAMRRSSSRLTSEQRTAALERLLEQVSVQSGLAKAEITGSGRRSPVVFWRRLIAYLAVTAVGASATETGHFLGLTTSAVLMALDQGRENLKTLKVKIEV